VQPKNLVKKRLRTLCAEHLPVQILLWIENDLQGATPGEIEDRVTHDYLIKATKEAIRAMRKPRRFVAVQLELHLISQTEFSFVYHLVRA
jgi:hypothetical protein